MGVVGEVTKVCLCVCVDKCIRGGLCLTAVVTQLHLKPTLNTVQLFSVIVLVDCLWMHTALRSD